MKHLRQVCAALVLAFVFTHSALAGQMSGPAATQPPPTPPAPMTLASGTTDGVAAETTASETSAADPQGGDTVIEIILNIVLTLL